MTILYEHDSALRHVTPPGHPEQIARIEAIRHTLDDPRFATLDRRAAPMGDRQDVLRCHPEDYVAGVEAAIPRDGIRSLDADTHVAPGSLDAAMRGVGACCAAVDAVVAGAFGSFMAAFTLAALEVQVAPPISSFFAENSYPLGQGKNVINVILVDFRSIDTLGEIVVLGIAAVGVFTLLRLRKERKPADIGSSGSPPSLGAAPLAPASPRDAEGSIS